MGKLLDSWTITDKKRFDFTVTVEHDPNAKPDDDDYNADDVAAWERGEWQFVTVTVTPVLRGGDDRVALSLSWRRVSGLPWGAAPDWSVGRKELSEYPVPELVEAAGAAGAQAVAKIMRAVDEA